MALLERLGSTRLRWAAAAVALDATTGVLWDVFGLPTGSPAAGERASASVGAAFAAAALVVAVGGLGADGFLRSHERLRRSEENARRFNLRIALLDEDQRRIDRIPLDQDYWTIYLTNSGKAPISAPLVHVYGRLGTWKQPMQSVEPGRASRQCYILRDTGHFPLNFGVPKAEVEFVTYGYRWRRNNWNDKVDYCAKESDPVPYFNLAE